MKDLLSVKRHILEKAREHFEQFGFEKTSLSAITTALGRSKTSIYYLFPDKEELFRQVVEEEFKDIRSTLEQVFREYDNPVDAFTAYLKERVMQLDSARAFGKSVSMAFKRGNLPVVSLSYSAREQFDAFETSFLEDRFHNGQQAGVFPREISPKAFSQTVSGLFRGIELQYYLSDRQQDMKEICNTLAELLVHRNQNLNI